MKLLVLSIATIMAASNSIANAQLRRDRGPDTEVKVACPVGTCGRLGGGIASGVQLCSAANCKKKAGERPYQMKLNRN
jgi:hypothetical protein